MERSLRKVKVGEVVKRSGLRTVSVRVVILKRHKTYGKVYKVSSKFLVDDVDNMAKVGDKVQIMECRPISKNKKWRLVEVVAAEKDSLK